MYTGTLAPELLLVAELLKKQSRPDELSRDGERVMRNLVAGIGFEPMTFRL